MVRKEVEEQLKSLERLKSFHAQREAKRAALALQDRPVPSNWDMRVARSERGVSFRVDDVEGAKDPINLERLAEQLEDRYQDRLLIGPGEHLVRTRDPQLVRFLRTQSDKFRRPEVGLGVHPLIKAVHTAFSEHRPLVLTPDVVWLVVAQGFSNHVKENAEALRASFVRHQGKKSIASTATSFTRDAFAAAIADISTHIAEEVNPVVHEALICSFSTTTPEARTASEIVLMDTFSDYFAYGMTVCGIPGITLEGTREDWETMRARLEVLSTYGLEWWVQRLRPIFDELVHTAEGRPSPEFWRAIYKPKEAYGSDAITGWIADLFPYIGRGMKKQRSHVFGCKRINWALKIEEGLRSFGVGQAIIPSAISKVAVQVNEVPIDFMAGFVGVREDTKDLALAPVIDWFVLKRANEEIPVN